MESIDSLKKIESELQEGMALEKCQKCGCMKDALESFKSIQTSVIGKDSILSSVSAWINQMKPIKYSCLGCKHCYPAVATNIFHQEFPDNINIQSAACGFEVNEKKWPPVPGEYFSFCEGDSCPVAITTLGSVELAGDIAKQRTEALCIVGKTETENIGIDKIIKNIISNPTIRILILAGKETQGHYAGKTLIALMENGVDEKNKVIGSPAKRPILQNVNRQEIDTFRKQVRIVDMIGCENVEKIIEEIHKTLQTAPTSCGCSTSIECATASKVSEIPFIQAYAFAPAPESITLDKAGYFVIIPQSNDHKILVEHYSYENILLRTIEGVNAREIYFTIIENNWVSLLSHAAYIGKELTKAELSMKLGFKYVQDGG